MKKFLSIITILFLFITSANAADMRFIQVDGALYDKNSTTKFNDLISKINKEKDVKFVVFTGNNIAKPNPKLLEEFLDNAKNLKYPYYIVLGQKDVSKQKNMSKLEYMEIVQKKVKTLKKVESPNYVFEKNKTIFIVLDGSKDVIPLPSGYYRPEVLKWLDEQLSLYSDKNVVILQHYPIVPPAKKETYYTFKAEEYLETIAKHKNIKAIISGHFNVNNEQTVNNILHISTKNAPTYRVIDILDYETANPMFWSTIKE